MSDRLNSALRNSLPGGIAGHVYDRSQTAGIVHLGLGAFHRAHQADYFDRLMANGEPGWMIRGVSLRSPAVAEQMNPQDGLFTLLVRDGETETARVIGSVTEVLVAPEQPAAVLGALAAPETDLVMLTITEKGYCLDSASGKLNLSHPDIRADIANPEMPRTAPGYLVGGLASRRAAGLAPFTILSCDNLFHNGEVTRQAVLALAREVDPDLARWIETEAAFPSSMVDRIVPATTEDDVARLEATAGYRDEAMVKTEPFSQWVVQDWFSARRPPLEQVGVQMTGDVAAWEWAKLRMLNGAHSALAYLGSLAGHDYIHEAIGGEGYQAMVNALWDETQETFDPPEGFDPRAYRAALLERFRNSALRHRTYQIAMDGSQKLPQRLLAPILERQERGQGAPALTLAVAGWMRWQAGVDESGRPYEVQDPMAGRTREIVDSAGGDAGAIASGLLTLGDVFDPRLRSNEEFVAALTAGLRSLMSDGAAPTVAQFKP